MDRISNIYDRVTAWERAQIANFEVFSVWVRIDDPNISDFLFIPERNDSQDVSSVWEVPNWRVWEVPNWRVGTLVRRGLIENCGYALSLGGFLSIYWDWRGLWPGATMFALLGVCVSFFRTFRPEDSRNLKRPFAEKRPRTDILNPGSLHLVGAFEHPWASMDVHSAHTLYNPTENGIQKCQRKAKFWCTFNGVRISRDLI